MTQQTVWRTSNDSVPSLALLTLRVRLFDGNGLFRTRQDRIQLLPVCTNMADVNRKLFYFRAFDVAGASFRRKFIV
jgi:hypothetical protein